MAILNENEQCVPAQDLFRERVLPKYARKGWIAINFDYSLNNLQIHPIQ